MRRFPWLRRWWKLGVFAVVVLTLPVVTVWYLEHRKTALVAEMFAAGAWGVAEEPSAPWLLPALGTLRQVGIGFGNRPSLAKPTEIIFRDESDGGRTVSREEMRRVVSAANALGTVREVEFDVCEWTPQGRWEAAALEPLREVEGLVSIDFQGRANDDTLKVVSGIRQLRELRFIDSHSEGLTAEGYGELAKLPNLEKLEILGPGPTEEDLAAIAQIGSLRTLVFETSHVDGAGLRRLADSPRLERLALLDSIPQSRFRDGSFERDVISALAAMPALRELRIGQRKGLSPEQIAKLKAALTAVTVTECDRTPAGRAKFQRW